MRIGMLIDQHTMEFGYCLYDPQVSWKPEGFVSGEVVYNTRNSIQLSTGSYTINEPEAPEGEQRLLSYVKKDN
jgi:uncharacterized protein